MFRGREAEREKSEDHYSSMIAFLFDSKRDEQLLEMRFPLDSTSMSSSTEMRKMFEQFEWNVQHDRNDSPLDKERASSRDEKEYAARGHPFIVECLRKRERVFT